MISRIDLPYFSYYTIIFHFLNIKNNEKQNKNPKLFFPFYFLFFK